MWFCSEVILSILQSFDKTTWAKSKKGRNRENKRNSVQREKRESSLERTCTVEVEFLLFVLSLEGPSASVVVVAPIE